MKDKMVWHTESFPIGNNHAGHSIALHIVWNKSIFCKQQTQLPYKSHIFTLGRAGTCTLTLQHHNTGFAYLSWKKASLGGSRVFYPLWARHSQMISLRHTYKSSILHPPAQLDHVSLKHPGFSGVLIQWLVPVCNDSMPDTEAVTG